ncbi:MAG: head GIN domain-containing protein [Flavobacteriaceae bacterium]
MKNILYIAFILFLSAQTFAQKETTKELEKFTEIKAFDRIEVTLIKSSSNKDVVTGEDRDEVSVTLNDGLLKIKMELDNHMDGGDIQAKVYYTEKLTLIDSNENAKIKSTETLTGDTLKIAVQEAGKVEMAVQVDQLEVKSTSGGEITLTGKTKFQEVVANAGGKVYNEKLNSEETKVTVNAGGRADVKASQKVVAKVRAGGTINIYGNPKEVEKDKVFGGKITLMD